ncbi:hypothetical protein [Nostoc sp.]|uniref:hypothetical protein n=1 Tax=Nostoc sp. TaxID=1180 RepID=UPI002FFA5503
MKAQIVEQVEFFSEAELESLGFVPEELEAIEAERVPDLESISFEDIAKALEAYFEGDIELEGKGNGGSSSKKGAEHTRNKTPSNQNKHENGQATTQAQETRNEYEKYRRKHGHSALSKKEWIKRNKPK